MSKFSEKRSKDENVVENYMGGKSFKQTPKEELIFSVVTSFIENTYYEKADKRIKRINELVSLIAKSDPLFIVKLAVVLRKEFHMRSAYHVLVGEFSKVHKKDSLIRKLIPNSAERPDDLVEIVAYYLNTYGEEKKNVKGFKIRRSLPNQIKKGVAEALRNFTPYQLAKYKLSRKEFSLVDLFNLVHPKPKDKKQSETWNKLLKGKLEAPETWEVRLSTEKDKAKVWRELVLNKKIGYMALLRNLRNIMKQGDYETVKESCKQIADKSKVIKSKQLPFRFLSAYNALEGEGRAPKLVFEKDVDVSKMMKEAVTQAVLYSVENLLIAKGKTVILSDNSGSMRGDSGGASLVSAMSRRTTADIANLFAVLYWTRADNTIVGLFGDKLIIPKLNREKDVFENFKVINKEANKCGLGTETGIFTILEKLVETKEKVDRIIIFSDCQVGTGCNWYDTSRKKHGSDFNSLLKKYQKINPAVNVYSVDLRGYGNKLFSGGVYLLSGWSDKIFELIYRIEKKEGMVKYVEDYKLNFV